MREIDLSTIRARLADKQGPAFWRSLEEVAQTPEFEEMVHREFPAGASEFADPAGRRQFLKLMSASLALAGASACTRQPVEPIIPYVRAPEEIIPGKPLYFATAMTLGGAATPILVESHMGRPTKIEPNPEHPATRGGTDVYTQASILTLYDPDRSSTLISRGEIRPWSAFLSELQGAMTAQLGLQGAGFRLLTEGVCSPTLAAQIQALLQKSPQAKWIQYDPISRDYARAGARQAFGEYVEPQYRLDQADVILSLDADLIDSGPAKLRHARDFADRRRLADGGQMNRLYVVESTATNTGAKADHRLPLKSREIEPFARALAAALGVTSAAPSSLPEGASSAFLNAVAKDLQAHRGRALVAAGDTQPPTVHVLAHAMNAALGAVGATVSYTATPEAVPTEQIAALRELCGEMNAGTVDLLVILSANPVYTAPADLRFAECLDKVRLRVHLGLFNDETAQRCHWHIPETHFLETWSDARAFDGTTTICQPLIQPLYDARSAHEIVGALAGQTQSAYEHVRAFWQSAFGAGPGAFGPLVDAKGQAFPSFDKFWRQAVHDGFIAGSAFPPKPISASATPSTPASAGVIESPAAGQPPAGLEITFRPDPTVYDGRFANNGWLQELPKPYNKVCWDNVALVSPRMAERLGLRLNDRAIHGVETEIIDIVYKGHVMQAPVWILPGQPDDSIGLQLGYGREAAGRVGNGVGFNANHFRFSSSPWALEGVEVRKRGKIYNLASTQGHFQMEGRHIVRAASLEEYRKDPHFAPKMGHEPPRDMSLYPDRWKYQGYAWGMSIDLNACIGCNACVVACVAENNIPVVGKAQVLRHREMHWLRIDRYHEGDLDNPGVQYQPVLCQQCENAPCEVVCPVAATSHSDEGLNDMVYNRCVGTRYCSHNCPYKVRRFNFLLYGDWNTPSLKMARNPDVTVRSRGVMEKCTYCVQRINAARSQAKLEDRGIRDGEIVTACEAACPASAIVFGDINDKNSRVVKAKADPRSYKLLSELNTRPRTTYQAVVMNPNPELTPSGATAHGAEEPH
jgi:MoCo/4Fe-4S cofactor protein with predicted Tat translocation signal